MCVSPSEPTMTPWFSCATQGRVQLVPGKAAVALIAPVFETGDPRYSWINEIQAVGKGVLTADRTRLHYEIYELQ